MQFLDLLWILSFLHWFSLVFMHSFSGSAFFSQAARPDLSYAASWDVAHKASAHVDKRRMPFLHNLMLQHGMQDTICLASFVFFLHYACVSRPHAFCSEKLVSALGGRVPHVCLYFCCWSSPVPLSSSAWRSVHSCPCTSPSLSTFANHSLCSTLSCGFVPAFIAFGLASSSPLFAVSVHSLRVARAVAWHIWVLPVPYLFPRFQIM